MKSGTFWLRYGTPSCGISGKYIRFGLRIETGAGRSTTTMMIVDIFDIIQQLRDTGIHLKVDEGPKSSSLEGYKREMRGRRGGERTYTCHKLRLAYSITPTLRQTSDFNLCTLFLGPCSIFWASPSQGGKSQNV